MTAGVVAHVPDFAAASSMGYHMSGMAMSGLMQGGMASIVAGLLLTVYGVIPFGRVHQRAAARPASDLHVHAMDGARLTARHWGLLFVLGLALVIDIMKPATLGFVVPGTKAEYGLTTGQVAMLPLVALGGTTIGSLFWGVLADRVGRRAAILLASILFIGTSICGFMPSFAWNLLMCFIMGISAGGMLPVVYALMAESMPADKRGWLVVLHGGLGTACGYLLASGLAALLEPHFTWRILWFTGLPTGALLLLLNRWIPESPRFLLEHGRVAEAEEVMRWYSVVVTPAQPVPEPATEMTAPPGSEAPDRTGSRLLSLIRAPYLSRTMTVGLYGLAWGIVNWGFITFVPTILRDRGLDAGSASGLLFWSALIAVPGTVLVASLYGLWSSRKSMILFAFLTACALVAFAILDPGSGGPASPWLIPLMVVLLVGSGGVVSMLLPYAAEVYPTQLRSTGSGFAAGASKLGGVAAPPIAALCLSVTPGFLLIGLAVAAPIALSGLVLAVAGVETRDRGLEALASAARFGSR